MRAINICLGLWVLFVVVVTKTIADDPTIKWNWHFIKRIIFFVVTSIYWFL